MLNVVDFFRENVGRLAPTTQRGYARYLRDLAEWVGDSEVTTELLLEWLDLHDWGLASRRGAIIALRSFFRWAVGEESPAARLHIPKNPESPRRALRPQQALDLLATSDTSNIKGKRNLAIIALMLDTGLRNSELCNALISNLSLQDCALQVLVKGGRWEWCVFTDYTQRALAEWMGVRDEVAVENRHIFVSLGGNKKGTKLGETGLQYIIRTIAHQAGLGHVCPHELRHSFATLFLWAGGSTRGAQLGGRWKSVAMVERYTGRIELETIRPHLPMNYLMNLE
ncbi:hypothetical protein LCGC14_2325590 [marine sediment metagenome]|uniref:Tyr recombinase domain-containing protein n=1 Tax=marine sediment metagenome TaxID=412755 RepID=A0A0F9ETY6_9ZZZZ